MTNETRSTRWTWILAAAGLLLMLGTGPGTAGADEWGCECRPSRCAPCGDVDPCHTYPSHAYRPRAYGGSWAVLRRYLTPTGSALRYFYVRSYFLRRYPHLFARGEPPKGTVIEREHFVHADYDVAATPRTPLQNLNYGMWQLHLGDYKAARATFRRVPQTSKVHAQASYGALMSAISSSRWDAAADDLAHLARIGALDAKARLEAEGLFGEKGKLANIMATVREHVRWRFEDAPAQLVGGWLYAVQGNARLARIYLAKAQAGLDAHPAVRTLLAGLDAKPAPKAPEQPESEAPSPPRAHDAVVADAKPILVSASR